MRRISLLVLGGILGCSSSAPSPSLDPGSYDLTLAAVTGSPLSSGAPIHVRLDVKPHGNQYDVVLTPDFGTPVATGATIESGALIIKPTPSVDVTPRPARIDKWVSFSIPLAGSSLGASASLVGTEAWSSPDTQERRDVSTSAIVVHDGRAPSLRLGGASAGETTYLPWDTLALTADEPLDVNAVASSAQATALGKPIALAPIDASWAGATTFRGALDPTSAGGAGALTFVAALQDRNGNVAPTATLPFTVLDVGAASETFAFDGADASQVGTWGAVANSSGTECEAGGCLRVGPFTTPACGAALPLGVAGRLTKAGATKLVFRARSSPKPTGPVNAEPHGALVVDVVGTSVTSTRIERTTLGDTWTTVSVPISTTAVGFAIRAFVEATCEPYPTPTALTLWVDAIHLE